MLLVLDAAEALSLVLLLLLLLLLLAVPPQRRPPSRHEHPRNRALCDDLLA
jgi:hypothetical protein